RGLVTRVGAIRCWDIGPTDEVGPCVAESRPARSKFGAGVLLPRRKPEEAVLLERMMSGWFNRAATTSPFSQWKDNRSVLADPVGPHLSPKMN
ncbi:unnamed protein product, partial [Linum tenue]